MPYDFYVCRTVVEMPEFLRQAKYLDLSPEERSSLIDMLAFNPGLGEEIPGTGGMRKLRVAAKGRGKSGGYRVITFFTGPDIPVFLVTIYAKNQKETITEKEKHIMKSLSAILVDTYRGRQT